MSFSFSYWAQPPWGPVWRGGRLPRKLKKRFNHNGIYMEPAGFRSGYTYPGHPGYKQPVIPSLEVGTYIDICWINVHIGKRVNGRWKPRCVWSEPRG